jgi:hypothetical protein
MNESTRIYLAYMHYKRLCTRYGRQVPVGFAEYRVSWLDWKNEAAKPL